MCPTIVTIVGNKEVLFHFKVATSLLSIFHELAQSLVLLRKVPHLNVWSIMLLLWAILCSKYTKFKIVHSCTKFKATQSSKLHMVQSCKQFKTRKVQSCTKLKVAQNSKLHKVQSCTKFTAFWATLVSKVGDTKKSKKKLKN